MTEDMDCLKKFFAEGKERERLVKIKLPRALQIHKRKFLCAIGKAEPINEEDEQFIKEFKEESKDKFAFLDTMFRSYDSFHWADTIATNSVKQILKEHQNFDIRLYLDCAYVIFLSYSGKMHHMKIYKALTYGLTHARLFGDPTQGMFTLEGSGSCIIEFGDISKQLPDSTFMGKITALINDLRIRYDEIKFRILNVNVTYLTLLILRRFVKNETQVFDSFKRINTHDDYVKLCPHPLYNQLPRINQEFNKQLHESFLKPVAFLAVHAFLNGNDDKTKRVLRATCLQYIEWTGLQMPSLFFKVVNLYGIEEAELWDSLSNERCYKSLMKLANDYYKQYTNSKADPSETVEWFPYCRALDGNYHRDLSASENRDVCMLLAYLVDLKMGFDKSFVRNSYWAKNCVKNCNYLQEAKKIFKKYNPPFAV